MKKNSSAEIKSFNQTQNSIKLEKSFAQYRSR